MSAPVDKSWRTASTRNQDTYTAWRASKPFTDEQIAQALIANEAAGECRNQFTADRLQRQLDYVRRGGLTNKLYALALPFLVKVCSVVEDGVSCGKTALYRYGAEGRCKRHRLVSTAGMDRYRVQRDQRHCAIEAADKLHERYERQHQKAGAPERARRQRR